MARLYYAVETTSDYFQIYIYNNQNKAAKKVQEIAAESDEDLDYEVEYVDVKGKSGNDGIYVMFEIGEYDSLSAREILDLDGTREEIQSKSLSGVIIDVEKMKGGEISVFLGNGVAVKPENCLVFEFFEGDIFESNKVVATNFDSFISETKTVTLKRQYTEKHPAMTAGLHAKIRNKVLEAIADGTLNQEELMRIVSEHSTDAKRWFNTNKKYFSVSEDGSVSLSNFGKRILDSIIVHEGNKFVGAATKAKQEGKKEFEFNGKTFPVTVKNTPKIEEEKMNESKFLYESFESFVKSTETMVVEAFKSMKLSNLFATAGNDKKASVLAGAIYRTSGLRLDQIEDYDLIEISPADAYKSKGGSKFVFYISDVEKENPYAPSDAYYTNKTVPGGGYLLGITDADNNFYGTTWSRGEMLPGGRRGPSKVSLKKIDGKPGSDSVGISKVYKGYDATGLYNAKRISEVADRAVVLDMDLLKIRYSAASVKAERAAAKNGATAFKSDKEFKDANIARYNAILTSKAMELPLDSEVLAAIDKLSSQIKDAVANNKMNKYNELLIGTDPKGRDVKVSDAANLMRNILDDYSRYCNYLSSAEEEASRWGTENSYYKREAGNYAKNVKDRIAKIENLNYSW